MRARGSQRSRRSPGTTLCRAGGAASRSRASRPAAARKRQASCLPAPDHDAAAEAQRAVPDVVDSGVTPQPELALEFGNPRLQRFILGPQRRYQRYQVFRGRHARRFANHPILESETAYAVEENLSLSPNLGSYPLQAVLPKRFRPLYFVRCRCPKGRGQTQLSPQKDTRLPNSS